MDTNLETIRLVASEGYEESLPCSTLREKSDYFRAMFDSGMREAQDGYVILPTISNASLLKICGYLKRDEFELSGYTVSEVSELLEATTYLNIPDASQICSMYLLECITVENCDVIVNLARDNGVVDLEGQAKAFRSAHFSQYLKTSQFVQLDFDSMCELLASSSIAITSELQVWKAIMSWLKSNKREVARVFNEAEHYEHSCLRLLDVLRFSCIHDDKSPLDNQSMLTLQDVFHQQRLDTFLKLYSREFQRARKYHHDPTMYHKQLLDSSPKLAIRNPYDVIIAVGGFTSRENASRVTCTAPVSALTGSETLSKQTVPAIKQLRSADLKTDSGTFQFKVHNKFKLPNNLCENGMCVLDGILYIAGGQVKYNEDGRHTTNAVHRFDPWRCQWTQVACMNKARSLFYLGHDGREHGGGRLYAVSGWEKEHTKQGPTKTVEAYDVLRNEWAFVCPMSDAMGEHTGCSHKGSMYISGGFKGPQRGHLDKLWRYNADDDSWTTLAPMLTGRSYHSMASVRDGMVVAGGVNYIGRETFADVLSCEFYNSDADQWSLVSTCPLYASCHSSLLIGTKLYMFGGHSFHEDTDHDVIQILDASNWTWSSIDMSGHTAKFFTCAIVTLPKHLL